MTERLQFTQPEPFTFDPRDWPKWKKRFEHYRMLTKLDKETDQEIQVSALVYSMGEKADEILSSLHLTDDQKKKYDEVLKAFDDHFVGKRNVVYERAKFGLRSQQEGESIDSFVTALHTLSEHCEYDCLRESLVRDRLILGVLDKQLSEKLMLTEKLDLKKAVQIAQQWESVKQQRKEIVADADAKLDRVQHASSSWKEKSKRTPTASTSTRGGKCSRCGRNSSHEECPAMNTICRKCGYKDHWSVVCKTKKVNRIREEKEDSPEDNEDVTAFLGALRMKNGASRQSRWKAEVQVDGKQINFKLDPGADVTVIPKTLAAKLWPGRKLKKSNLKLTGPDGANINSCGMFLAKMRYKMWTITEEIHVVPGLMQSLLGVGACEDLHMVARIGCIEEKTTDVEPFKEYPKLFQGLGKLDHPYQIVLKEDAKPYAIASPRRVPLPMMEKVKSKLNEMVNEGVITPVEEPTEWCAPMVIAAKGNGDIRLCVDLTKLNKCVERELHPMPVVEHTLGQVGGSKVFSKLDANSGFYQIALDEKSQKLTTFMTPFGRFKFQRLPMGITSAPEHFQKRLMQILEGIQGVAIHVDDILVHGKNKVEHDIRLREVLSRLQAAGITLSKAKCQFGMSEIKFLGHVINGSGVQPDPEKIRAIVELKSPTNVSEVRQILGMVNFVGRFLPNLTDLLHPLNELLRADKEFAWGSPQEEAFRKVKVMLTSKPVLALYQTGRETKISADASSYGLGAVILQKDEDGCFKPVAYASRTLTPTERRYAQIEKEALASTWACERFKDYILGLHIKIETDHKPLIQILGTKELDELSPRLQRFRMRLLRYHYDVEYTPGKQLFTADLLSRQPLPETGSPEDEKEVEAQVHLIVSAIPASNDKLAEIMSMQHRDLVCQKLASYCKTGWPKEKKLLEPEVQPYWSVKDEITIQEGLLVRGVRLIIPACMRDEMLGRLHSGHMGIVKSRSRARETIWWPGISEQIAEIVRRCRICAENRDERHEPLIPSEFPERPWQKLGMDLFKLKDKWFIVVMDYYSRYPEIAELENLSAATVVNKCKSFFARHGVPEEVRSDCGTQFKELEQSAFKTFANEYGFVHRTSSPRYPQSNGFAEAAVKTVKSLLKKSSDPYLALLEYRATPLSNGFSPAELLMGRRIKTTLPIIPRRLVPEPIDRSKLQEKEKVRIDNQKRKYDHRHGVLEKQEFPAGTKVWIKDLRLWGEVRKKLNAPRSYLVDTPRGQFRRNSFHLVRGFGASLEWNDDNDSSLEQSNLMESREENVEQPTVTRYGRVVREPAYLKDYVRY